MKRILVFVAVFLLSPLNIFASKNDKMVISCDNSKVNVNDQLVCRVSADSEDLFNKINYKIELSDGLEIVDVRSNYVDLWEVKSDHALSKELNNGIQEFGIILVKAIKSGEMKITLKDISLEDTINSKIYEVNDISNDIKVISDDNLLKDIIINDKSIDNYSPSKLSYNYFIDESLDKIIINAISNNQFSDVKGNGEYELSLNNGKFIFPIKVVSENGNAKVYIINVMRNNFNYNDIDKNLESLKITDNNKNILLINFKPDKYEYNIEVNSNTKYLNIEPTLNNNDLSFEKGYGEQKIDLNNGDNVIFIKVKDNKGEILTYTINVIKPLINKSDNTYIKELNIKGYDLKFNKRVKKYTLEISEDDKSLSINPVLEHKNASYEIVGNNNLKEGSVIKIIVTAENQIKATYQISIKIKEVSYFSTIVWIILGLGLLASGIYMYFKYKSVLKLKKIEFEKKKKLEEEAKAKELEKQKKAATKKKNTSVKKQEINSVKPKKSNGKINTTKKSSSKNSTKKSTSNKKKTIASKNVKQTKKNSTNKSKTTTKAVKKDAKKK